jgi:hypothetical protein
MDESGGGWERGLSSKRLIFLCENISLILISICDPVLIIGSKFSLYFRTNDYPNVVTGKDRTLFIRLLEAEKKGLLVVSVDPPMIETSTGWENDPSPFLMDARFAMQVGRIYNPHLHGRFKFQYISSYSTLFQFPLFSPI